MTIFGALVQLVVIVIGIFQVTKYVGKKCNRYYTLILTKIFKHKDLKILFGKWAVVTAGTEGIGEAYTREFASRGLNVMIIGENLERLHHITSEVESHYPKITVRYIQANLRGGKGAYERIRETLKDLDVGILVNNTLLVSNNPQPMHEMSEDEIMDHVLVNMAAPTIMSNMLIPDMKQRGRGAIVNVCFTPYCSPDPGIYTATKAYLKGLSKSLQFECQGSYIQVQTLMLSLNKLIHFFGPVRNCLGTEVSQLVKKAVDGLAASSVGFKNFDHEVQVYYGE